MNYPITLENLHFGYIFHVFGVMFRLDHKRFGKVIEKIVVSENVQFNRLGIPVDITKAIIFMLSQSFLAVVNWESVISFYS